MKMKKSTIGLLALASVTLFGLVGTVLNTISWFVASVVTPEYKLNGSSAGAYFAYGDGSEEHPYGISIPRHLYNLSWLHYLGQFEDGQYYFELADSLSSTNNTLDMSGYILPPIGTEDNPFVSNFNGKGKIIANLTVSNDESSIFGANNKHPDRTQVDYTAPRIVGLFGVVGNLDDAYEGEYVSATNTIYNLGIENVTVKSSTSNTLVGIAAGYVDGLLENVAVNDSSLYTSSSASAISSITDCVSNYSLVGYCTEDYLGEMKLRSDDADIPTLENPNTQSGGDNWGGSINMQEMYTYLSGVRRNSTRYSFVSAETVTVGTDGTTSEPTPTGTTYNGRYDSGFGYTSYTGYKATVDGDEYASFSIATSYSNYNFNTLAREQYVCLYGPVKDKRATTAGYNSTTNANKTVTTANQYIRISNGTNNYLRCVGTGTSGISNSTTADTNTGWRWDGNYLYYTYNSTKYYLNISGGNLTGNTSGSTQWTYSESAKNIYATVSGTTYYLDLNGTTWRVTSTGSNYYLIHDGNNYMTHSENVTGNGNVSNTSSTTEPTSMGCRWYWLSGNMFSATNGGTTYYLRRNNTSNSIQYGSNNSNQFVASAEYGDNVTLIYNRYNAYYNGSTWRNERSDHYLTITKKTAAASEGHNITCTTYTSNSTSNVAATYDTYPTYFPLTRDKDDDGNYTAAGNAGKPDEKNTGYLVSGANMTTPSNQVPFGDVRVSYFAMSYLNAALNQNTYDDNKLEVVTRTCVRGDNGRYTDSDWTRISDDKNSGNTSINSTLSSTFSTKKNYKSELRLNKYKNSRSQLGSSLSSSGGNIYGLHFMDAAISTDRLVTAPKAIVLDGKTLDEEGKATGSVYTSYQLPQDSIDFNLKDQGFINFFAGSYFTDNDAFFSLHKITRNDSTHNITSIQEIKKIYAPKSGEPSNDNPYVYSFDGSQPANSGDLVFDTAWIKTPSIVMNALYYFEIPVNAGEYALGSVSGGIGAYLMYLDIGAGINNYHDIITTEHVVTIAQGTSFPKGIEFHAIVAGTPWSGLEGGDTACVKVNSGTNAQQTLTFTYGDSILTVSTTGNDPPIAAEYEAVGVGIKKKVGDASATDLTFSPPTLYTIERDAITSENYNIFTSVVTKTIEETYTITGAKSGVKIQLSLPQQTAGFTPGSTVFTVVDGPASVNQSGLITITGTGDVEVSMTYSESKANVEEWNTALVITDDSTEGTIFEFHLRDYNMPNLVTSYVYDGATYTYNVYLTATEDTYIEIDALPPEGYTVVVIVNGDTAHPTTLTSTSQTTSITITV